MAELLYYRGVWIPTLEKEDKDFRTYIKPYKRKLNKAIHAWIKGKANELNEAIHQYNEACKTYIDQKYGNITKFRFLHVCLPI